MLSGMSVISEKGCLPRTAACHFQTFTVHVDLFFFYTLIGTSLLPEGRAGSHAHLNPNAIQPNPEVLCVPGTEDKKKVGKDQQV